MGNLFSLPIFAEVIIELSIKRYKLHVSYREIKLHDVSSIMHRNKLLYRGRKQENTVLSGLQ